MSWQGEGSNYSVAYTGTGVARSFTCGFEPSHISVVRLSDGNVFDWQASLSSGASFTEADPAFDAVSSSELTVGKRAIALGTDAKVNDAGVAYLLWAAR